MKTIILFGDSHLGHFGWRWMSKLETKLKNSTVYNCAAGGLNTKDGIKQAPFISKLKPDYVILSFGGNDAATWKDGVPIKEFESNYNQIVESFNGSKVILFLPPPANDSKDAKGTEEYNESLLKYNKLIREISKRKKTGLIDSERIYGKLLDKGKNYHEEDGVHLNDKGYEILIKELVKQVKK